MYEFLIGAPPFEAKGQKETYDRIISVDIKWPTKIKLSNEAKDLITKVTNKNKIK
jgi:hypothetical protein